MPAMFSLPFCGLCTSVGSFAMYVCPVSTPTDFYPMFWSSSGSEERHCVYEAAYPRSTLPLVYFGATIVFLLTVRLVLTAVCWRKHPHNSSLCGGLIALPCLAVLHVALSGLLCEWVKVIHMHARTHTHTHTHTYTHTHTRTHTHAHTHTHTHTHTPNSIIAVLVLSFVL